MCGPGGGAVRRGAAHGGSSTAGGCGMHHVHDLPYTLLPVPSPTGHRTHSDLHA